MTDNPTPERRNFYGRVHGKTLRASQKSYLAEDLDAALALLKGLKPHIRKFQSQPVTQLVNGDLCLSLGYSGDMTQARRAGISTTFALRMRAL